MVSKTRMELVVKWWRRGYEAAEIARLLGMGVDECRAIILNADRPEGEPKRDYGPEFIEQMFE